jgi:hypothetical protein
MAVKTKANRKKSKARARALRAKPLLGSVGYVRKQKSKNGSAGEMTVPPEKASSNAAPMASVARMMVNSMAMPMRLAGSSLPLEIWRAQALLAYQGLLAMQSIAFGRPMGRSPRIP